jgi:hypothetical protein
MFKRSRSNHENGRVSLAEDLATALQAAETRPPWERTDSPEQRLDILLAFVHAPIGTRWRYQALEKLHWLVWQAREEIPDWQERRRALAWELEDEDEHAGRPSRYHDCSRGKCICVPPAPRGMKH